MQTSPTLKRTAGSGTGWFVLAALMGVGCYIGYLSWESQQSPTIDTAYRSGDHLLYVVAPEIASSDSLILFVSEGRDSLRQFASREGLHFGTIGVSFDWSVQRGIGVLDKLGPFDEYVVGRNWLNDGVRMYMSELQVRPSVPQVVIFIQSVVISDSLIQFGPLQEKLRLKGVAEIAEWSHSGYPLPPARTNSASSMEGLPRVVH